MALALHPMTSKGFIKPQVGTCVVAFFRLHREFRTSPATLRRLKTPIVMPSHQPIDLAGVFYDWWARRAFRILRALRVRGNGEEVGFQAAILICGPVLLEFTGGDWTWADSIKLIAF